MRRLFAGPLRVPLKILPFTPDGGEDGQGFSQTSRLINWRDGRGEQLHTPSKGRIS